ncbi:Eukaryotic translation initiation factor 3 subunit, putative [Ricinus communis]|uniref:Eukaryotic translation initiation factor 3 subunit G n=1 Tax=Ricinus communis TaxID=3988 RepID=B9SV55_RICCO|nr:Eukaryotic translation initiation factor 3 subunit, putative [Ricinus communis]|eukprot:XP_002529874.1 eukaryotic translation initiation factor 3 subunit G [Ricinus communis]
MPLLDGTDQLRWSGVVEEQENEKDLKLLLPPRQVIGPDKNGLKKVIEYKFNDKGQKVRITTTTRLRKTWLTKGALERRSWPRFGDAVNDNVGGTSSSRLLTTVSSEEIFLQRPKSKGTKAEETETSGESLSLLANKNGVLMVCRTCCKKGDHWTSKCPYKDVKPQLEGPTSRPPSADNSAASSITAMNSKYIPPSMRAGAQRSSNDKFNMKRRNDENTVRVSCISENTSEADLVDLFSPFGQVSRVFLLTDRHTGLNRGSGFVSFVNKEDAERAINKLDGYGYDNLILHVEKYNRDGSKSSPNKSKF